MKSYTYFSPAPETLEELKAQYRQLALKHHPDRAGGDTETMKAINNEYDLIFPLVKDIHKSAKGETYTRETEESPDQYRDIVAALIKLRMVDVRIELIGSFLWVSGNTKAYKDDIKALGFKWSKNKTSWYLAPEGYHKRSHKSFTMGDIRDMFGCVGVTVDEPVSIPA